MRACIFAGLPLLAAIALPADAQSVTLAAQETMFDGPMFTKPIADIAWNNSAIHYGWFNRLEEFRPKTQPEFAIATVSVTFAAP